MCVLVFVCVCVRARGGTRENYSKLNLAKFVGRSPSRDLIHVPAEHSNIEFYILVSVRHKSILYKEPTRCNFGSIVNTVVCTPDDGRRRRPKHVECSCSY
jgi:hypothetical protein